LDLIQKYWDQIVGAILIFVGIVWIVKKKIPVGVEGREPLFHLKGNATIFLGAIIVIIGLLFLLNVININWFSSH
jgi:hypothetical protein